MKVCIIGAAGHFQYALRALKRERDVKIVGIAPGSIEENIEKLQQAVVRLENHPQPKVYMDVPHLLDETRPDIAVVNPLFAEHARIAIQALERGIHVFVEKPMATTWDDLARLRQAYAASGAQLTAMFGIRYRAPFLTAKHALEKGVIGEVRLLQAQKSYRLGQRPPFFKRRERYGGTIPWVGSHAIDWLYWFGGHRFQSVFATHSALHNQAHGELEVAAQCLFQLENEAMATVSIDYLRPATAPSHDDDRIRIVGTKGVLEIVGGRVTLINAGEAGVQELPLVQTGNIFSNFLRQVRGQGECIVRAEDAFYVTEACLRARDSADQGTIEYF